MFERIRYMLRKEFIQLFRDPRMKTILFVAPLIELIVFGYAATTDVKHVKTAIYDLDQSVSSRDLTQRFASSGYFDIVENIGDDNRLRELMDRGEAILVVRMDKGFEGDLLPDRTAEVQLIADGTDSNTVQIALGYSATILSGFQGEKLQARIVRRMGAFRQPQEITLETRSWFNENLESRNFFLPGVIAMLVMLTTLMLTSMAIVREKEIGTIEQILVTPIRPYEFILGKTVPFVLVGFADVILVTLVAVFWFQVPIRGNLLILLLGIILFLMTTIGIGLIVSTLSRTQQQAMMSTMFFALPAVMLSGFMFPIRNMPEVIQWFTYIDPLRYLLIVIRGVFLKGVGLDILWPQLASLFGLGVVTLTFASRRFHKTLS